MEAQWGTLACSFGECRRHGLLLQKWHMMGMDMDMDMERGTYHIYYI